MLCNESFTIFLNRRHHCRLCGYLVCGYCSSSDNHVEGMGSVRLCTNCERKERGKQQMQKRTKTDRALDPSFSLWLSQFRRYLRDKPSDISFPMKAGVLYLRIVDAPDLAKLAPEHASFLATYFVTSHAKKKKFKSVARGANVVWNETMCLPVSNTTGSAVIRFFIWTEHDKEYVGRVKIPLQSLRHSNLVDLQIPLQCVKPTRSIKVHIQAQFLCSEAGDFISQFHPVGPVTDASFELDLFCQTLAQLIQVLNPTIVWFLYFTDAITWKNPFSACVCWVTFISILHKPWVFPAIVQGFILWSLISGLKSRLLEGVNNNDPAITPAKIRRKQRTMSERDQAVNVIRYVSQRWAFVNLEKDITSWQTMLSKLLDRAFTMRDILCWRVWWCTLPFFCFMVGVFTYTVQTGEVQNGYLLLGSFAFFYQSYFVQFIIYCSAGLFRWWTKGTRSNVAEGGHLTEFDKKLASDTLESFSSF